MIEMLEERRLLSVNQPPVNTVPGTQQTTEMLPLAFTEYRQNRISVFDPDAGSNPIKVRLQVDRGALSFAYPDPPGSNFTYVIGDGRDDRIIEFTAPQAIANKMLEWLYYTPPTYHAYQWKAENGGNNHWYEYRSTSVGNWTQSRDFAAANGGYLATITSQAEQDFVNSILPANSAVWLGGFQDRSRTDYTEPSGAWRWVTGETWSYMNWNPSEPNNGGGNEDFLELQSNKKWNDLADSLSRNLLVEYDYDPRTVFDTLTVTTNDQGYFGTGGPKQDTDTVRINFTKITFGDSPNWSTIPAAFDTSFDGDGRQVLSVSNGLDILYDLLQLSDGKLLAVGAVNNRFGVLRFNSNLTLDATFGTNGVVESNFGEGRHAYAVQLDREGRYLVGGVDFLARYLNNGQLDTSFGTNGKAAANQTNPIYDIDIQADGKILTAGRDGSNYWVSRFLIDGTLEATWAYHENAYHHTRGIQIDDTGDFLISGRDGTDRLRVTRANVSGTEEASFQYDLPGYEFYRSSLRLPDGKMLLVGESNGDVAVTRHLASGAIDTTFGNNGSRIFPGLNAGDTGWRASLQPDGRILLAGESFNGVNQDILVARMSYDGVLDTTFNTKGVRAINLSGDDYGYGIISQPDGKIVIAGRSGNDIALVRLYGDSDVFGERPTLSPIADQLLSEDFGTNVVDLTGIAPGGSSVRPLRILATSSSPGRIPNPTVQYVSPGSNGKLILSSMPNMSGDSVITVTVEDGGEDANLGTTDDNRSYWQRFTVSVTEVNDPPTLTATGLSPIYIEDATASTLYRSANASTIEEVQRFTSLSLTVSNLSEASSEVLVVNGAEIPLVAGSWTAGTINSFELSVSVKIVNTTATVVISHIGLTKEELETLVNTLQYRNTSQNPTLGNRLVTISQLVDSGSNSSPNDNTNEALAIVSAVIVVPVNDAPVAVSDTFFMDEDASLSVGGVGVKVNDSDPDHPLNAVNAVLVTSPLNALSFSFRSDGTFDYRPNTNFSGQVTFTYKLNDGSLDSNLATVTINIAALNDAPTITVPGPQTTNEDTPRKIPSITVGDIDATTLAVTLAVANGSVTLGTTTGLTFSSGSNGTSTFTINGTIANLNASLASVTYIPNLNFNGSDTLVATVSDLGATGLGGILTATGNIAITVSAVNDPPYDIALSASSVNENTSTATELMVGTLSASDFDAGDTASFSILAGLDGTFFDLSMNQLRFKPGTVLDFETKPSYQFNMRVTDSAGATFDKVLQVSVVNLPEVSAVQVEDGSVQRSMITQLIISFDSQVVIGTKGLRVRNRDTDQLVSLSVMSTLVSGNTVATIRFSGSASVIDRGQSIHPGASVDLPDSLKDGNYELIIDGTAIAASSGGLFLDAAKTGLSSGSVDIFGDQAIDHFYRLFGDSDGDRDIDALNNLFFRQSLNTVFGNTRYRDYFDWDGDGDLDSIDESRFLENLNKILKY
jgi:uncharacterized delta-60 repeat protein